MSEYVNEKRFAELVLEAQATGKGSEELCEIASAIAIRIMHSKCYPRQLEKEDAISIGVLCVLANVHRYKPEKSKAFHYFSQIIINTLREKARGNKRFKKLRENYWWEMTGKPASTYIQN
jgi:DNA-directed RNA polymerase specialized sigma subunit